MFSNFLISLKIQKFHKINQQQKNIQFQTQSPPTLFSYTLPFFNNKTITIHIIQFLFTIFLILCDTILLINSYFTKVDMKNTIQKFSLREVQIGRAQLGKFGYDDNLILIKNRVKNYKINSVTISLAGNKYVNGLNFTYLDLDTDKIIQGNKLIANTKAIYTKTFILQKDEFIININYRRGSIIDSFGFLTNKNNSYQYGGDGGKPYQFKLKKKYHMGACAISGNKYIAGIKFDQISMPCTIASKEKFIFFQNELYFYFATKYLTCAQTLNLLLLSKNISQYRLTSRQFWLKLLYSYDYYLINYLKRLCKIYQIYELASLIQDLQIRQLQFKIQVQKEIKQQQEQEQEQQQQQDYYQYYRNSRANRINNKDNFKVCLNSTYFQNLEANHYYMLIVGASILNYLQYIKDKSNYFVLKIQDNQIQSILLPKSQYQNQIYQKSIGYKKFAIYFKNTPQNIKRLIQFKLMMSTNGQRISGGDKFYITEVINMYAMIVKILPQDILFHNFEKISQQIYLNYDNTKLTKD